MDSNIVNLSVIEGGGENRVSLYRKFNSECNHSSLEYCEGDIFVTCRKCKKALNPIAILKTVLSHDSWWRREKERFDDVLKKLEKRNRTKCEKCGGMTTIIKRGL